MSKNAEVVSEFIDAWGAGDLDRIMSYFAPDALYHNIPMEELRGTEAIRPFIDGFLGMASGIQFQVHHMAETEAGVVLTERTDRFEISGGSVALPVMGAFEIEDGKIAAWRDYFDMSQFQNATSG